VLDYLNNELKGPQFLAGEFSVADVGFAPRLLILGELGIDAAANRANVDGWIKRMLERPSIQGLQGASADPVAAG
jgi:glutathione S-transferase